MAVPGGPVKPATARSRPCVPSLTSLARRRSPRRYPRPTPALRSRAAAQWKPARRSATVVFVTANNTLPYDRRVWQEARFVRGLGANVIGVSPAGLGPERPSEPFVVVDGIPIHRFRMQEAEAGLAAYGREFAGAFAGTART